MITINNSCAHRGESYLRKQLLVIETIEDGSYKLPFRYLRTMLFFFLTISFESTMYALILSLISARFAYLFRIENVELIELLRIRVIF